MGNNTEKLKLLHSVAKEYYLNDAKQKEIADKLDINRVQVSRYLKEAREKGIVRFEINNPLNNKHLDIESELIQQFEVERAFICSVHKTSKKYILQALAEKTGEYINNTFKPQEKIGVGWGLTMYEVAKSFSTDKDYKEIKFVPLTGSAYNFPKEFQTNSISLMLAEEFNGISAPLQSPFHCASREEYELMVSNFDIKSVTQLWENLDRVLVGIGSNFSRTPLLKLESIGEEELTGLLDFRQVGDILTHYFNFEGDFYDLDIQNRLINFPLEFFDNVNEVIAVAGGEEKKESILGALRSGKVSTIIVDRDTAREVLALN